MFSDVFIAYSHKDAALALRLNVLLAPLGGHIRIHFQDIGDTDNDSEWMTKLASAKVCVLLVSPDLLASSVMTILPVMLDTNSLGGQTVAWVPASRSPVEGTVIRNYQAASDPRRPLDTLTPRERDDVLARIAHFIKSRFPKGEAALAPETPKQPAPAHDTAAAPAPEEAAEKAAAKEAAGAEKVGPGAGHTFVCYAREDSAFVLDMAAHLKAAGANVWLDQWDIPSGADWDYEVDRALYGCAYFLIVLSTAAVESGEVRSELRTALDEHKRIVPVLYQKCRIPRRLKLIQHIDFTESGDGRDAALRELVGAVTP